MNKIKRSYFPVFLSGILNIILGILHQIVLYFEYQKYSKIVTPETLPLAQDFLLFSIGIGIVLIFMGAGTCYCYFGLKRNEKWAAVIAMGIGLILFVFVVGGLFVMKQVTPVTYIHLLNGFFILIPIWIHSKRERVAS